MKTGRFTFPSERKQRAGNKGPVFQGCLGLLVLLCAWPATGQVTNSLPGRVLVKMIPDYLRPKVYALNKGNGTLPGTLLALNATNGATLAEINVNVNPSDMAMTPPGDTLYVINRGSRTISKINLDSFSVVAEQSITTPNTYDPNNPLYLAAGRSNTIYFTDGGWGPTLYTFDYAAGTNISSYNDGYGAGGMVLARDGNTMYKWMQYGWSAGYANSWITRLDAHLDSALSAFENGPGQSRDPLDTPILLDGSATRVFNKVQMVAATNVSVLLSQFTENIYAISLDGSLAFGPTKVFNAQNGIALTNFPISSTVQTLSGSQQKLFRYQPGTSFVYVYDMAAIAPVSGPNLAPTPADGSVVGLPPTNLLWTVSPIALAYDVYLGTNQAQVTAATQGSAQYLGRVTSPAAAPNQPLTAGTTFYWRVDVVGFSVTNAGPTWSFIVSQLSVNPASISVGAIAGYNPAPVTLSLTSVVAKAWTVSVAGANWLTASPGNGTSPSTLTFNFATAGLAAGSYTNRVDINSGGAVVQVPVTLDVKPLNILKMATDYQRPYIYALQAPAASGQNGQLLFINSTNGNIDRTLPIGINPVDLTVHYGEGRLYIASWTENATYVVDLTSQTVLPPLHLGTDVYKINAGKPGQIMIEGEDQWVYVNLINTTNGGTIVSGFVREGDGEFDPTGRYYYHSDNNISGAGVTRFDMSTNTFAAVAGNNGNYYYGSRNVILSPDGTAVFWTGEVYDANLNKLGNLGEEIYTTTAHGDLAIGGQHVFNAHNGQVVYTLPFSTSISAVAGDQKTVFLFNGTSKQLVMIPMSSIAVVPGPGLNPVPANGATINLPLTQLSWSPGPYALGYQVFFGTNQAAVAAATTNSPLYLGTTSSNVFVLANTLAPALTYYWRVDTLGFNSVTAGTVWTFTSGGISISPQTLSFKGVTGLPILAQSVSLSAPTPTGWTLSLSQPWLSASQTNGTTPSSVTLFFNTTNLAAGYYTNQLSILAGGTSLQVPVILQLIDLNASKMVADRNRNMIYVLHPGSGSFADAFLLFLNTDSGVVEKVMPIGTNPTDLSINQAEDRIYVSNWQYNQTRVVDLVTRTESTPLSLGTDIYKINGGAAGRIVTEGEDQWISMCLVDTVNGTNINCGSVREGDGEFDPTGRYYYHCDNNISGAGIGKYDTSSDTFSSVAGAGGHYYYGSRNLVMSLDGSRLFWTSAAYDANLVDLGVLGSEIYGCSTNGSIAFSATQAIDSSSKQLVYTLPVNTSVMAVDRLDQRLWYFNGTTKRVESIPMLTIRSPHITQQPAGTAVVLGGSVSMSVAATGYAPFSYQWFFQGTNISGQTSASLVLTNILASQEGDYQAMINNYYGAVTSAVAHVTVVTPPAFTAQPQSTNVSGGQTIVLSALATGTAPLSYSWKFEGITIPGASGTTLTITNAQAINEGSYQALAANSVGSTPSAQAYVRVLPSAPSIVSGPASATVPAASNITFSVTTSGSLPMSFQWKFNGTPVLGATTAQYSINNVQSSNAGSYQVVVSNGAGSASGTATLTVTPVIPYFTTQPIGIALPAGTNFTMTALARGTEPLSYQWRQNGTALNSATQTSLSFSNLSLAHNGSYDVVAINSAGSWTSSVASLVVTAAPPVFQLQPASASAIAGATVTLTSRVSGSAPLQLQWYFQNAILVNRTNAQLVLSNVTAAAAGPYFIIASNQFDAATSTVAQLTVNLPVQIQQGISNQVVSAGDTITLAVAATGTGRAYSWAFNGTTLVGATNSSLTLSNLQTTQSGYYRVSVGNQFGPTLSAMGRISVLGPPSIVTAWGDNSGGQTNVPSGLNDIVAVAGGDYHTLALRRNGTLTAWGYNGDDQTRVPANPARFVAIASGAAHGLAITENGNLVAWGRNDANQTNVPVAATNVVSAAAGDSHSLILLSGGTVLAWGDNTYGQGVVPQGLSGVKAIAAGRQHNLALRSNGTVAGWGLNNSGQATPPPSLVGVTAITAGYLHSAALLNNGTVVVWGDNSFAQTNAPPGLSNVISIAAGDFHTLALRSDGSVVGWGDDTYTQTDVPDNVTNAIAIACGDYHALAMVATPLLRYRLVSGKLALDWNGPGVLQSAPTPYGPYTDVQNAGPGYTNADSAPIQFFRLRW